MTTMYERFTLYAGFDRHFAAGCSGIELDPELQDWLDTKGGIYDVGYEVFARKTLLDGFCPHRVLCLVISLELDNKHLDDFKRSFQKWMHVQYHLEEALGASQ